MLHDSTTDEVDMVISLPTDCGMTYRYQCDMAVSVSIVTLSTGIIIKCDI